MRPSALRLLSVVVLSFRVLFSLGAEAPRYALVIGNGNYSDLGKLKNPVNDATDMAAALKSLGFQVSLLTDADLPTMEDAVQRLGNALSQSAESMGLFFYAGHGVQSGGINFLIPADARIISEPYLKTKALPTQSVLDTLQSARNALNVVILDACRDNPFSWGRSASRGLNVVGSQPPGSIVAYATSAGSVAQDGTGRNGVFTAELLKQIRTPGLEIAEVFKRTGAAVQAATTGKQVPAVYNQFFGNAYLAGAGAALSPAAQASATVASAPTMTVTRSYGSLAVSAVTAGSLYLDGVKLGDVPAGAKANLNNIEVGDRSLELRYADGQVEKLGATVAEGQATRVSFSYKKATAQAQPAAGALPPGFVLVPGGSFTMGSPASETGRDDDEVQHQVSLRGFAISKYDLTFDEYDAYCAATGTAKPNDQGWGRGSRPVINVSWYDAVSYCNWRSTQDGKSPAYTISGTNVSCDFSANGYRLPTEAEWEYAAKGGPSASSLAVNAVYAGSPNLDAVAWYSGNSGNQTHPVGQKAPNALGLFDMGGNVWQWCQDWYAEYPTANQSDPSGPASGGYRVLRGGSWISGAGRVRSAYRRNVGPGDRDIDFGFRLVASQIGR